MAGEARDGKRWFPLESNPEVMTTYSISLGMSPAFQWTDVLSTDDWALEMVPQPVKAVVMLFPIKDVSEAHREQEAERIEAEGQEVTPSLYYKKQRVGNACGTVGIMHSLLNNLEECTLEDSYLRRFYAQTIDMSPEERAVFLEGDAEVDEMHVEAAQQGQSEQIAMDERVDTHFVAFVEMDGGLYELDGRKRFPVRHGDSCPETLLRDATNVVKEFMARDPEELRFTMTALVAAGEG